MVKKKNKKIKHRDYIEVPHAIKVLKDNEKKYTIILVIIFMLIISYISYRVLTIDNSDLYNSVNFASNNYSYVSLNSSVITLTKDDIKSNEEGLVSTKRIINIVNNTNKIQKYKIYLKSDYKDKCICGNDLINKNYIHYSIDGREVLSVDDDLFIEGKLNKKEKKDIEFTMWVSNQVIEDLHFHGHFVLENHD